MRKSSRSIVVVALALLVGGAFADDKADPKVAKAKKYLQASGTMAWLEKEFAKIGEPLAKGLDAETVKKLDAAAAELEDVIAAKWAHDLSVEDLDAGIKFFETPAGKKLAAATAASGPNATSVIEDWIHKKIESVKGKGGPAKGEPAKGEPAKGGNDKAANEAAAIGALKTLVTSQTLFREGDKENDGVLDYGTLADLLIAKLVDDKLGTGKKSGYVFETFPGTDPNGGSEFLFWATASPEKPGVTGDRYFFVNQAGVIWYSKEPIKVDKVKAKPVDEKSVTPVGK